MIYLSCMGWRLHIPSCLCQVVRVWRFLREALARRRQGQATTHALGQRAFLTHYVCYHRHIVVVCIGAIAKLWRADGMGGRGRMGPQPQRACIQGSWRQHGLQALPPPAPLHKTADRYNVRPCIGPSSQFDYAQSCKRAACWACHVSILLPLRVRGLILPWTVAMGKVYQSLHHAPPVCLLLYLFRL